jgi:hypothetical protein
VNVYPGVLGGIGRDFGLWMVVSHDLEFRVGISSRYALGIGLGYGRAEETR